jgi:2-oxoglutarate dehydrogenase E1 component
MATQPIASVFNDGYIAEAYEAFRRDPGSVDESWRQFFRFAESLGAAPAASSRPAQRQTPSFLKKIAGVAELIDSIRAYGHLAAEIDPLGSRPPGTPELTPEFHWPHRG